MIDDSIKYLGSFIKRLELEDKKVAITTVYNGKNYTYADLNYRSDRLASFLKNTLQLKKKDAIAFVSRNSIEFFDGFYAGLKTGIVIASYNYLFSKDELIEYIERDNVKAVFFDASSKDLSFLASNKNKSFKTIALYGNSETADYNYEDIFKYDCSYEEDYTDVDDPLMYMYTGGTTGAPKTAVISGKSILMNAISQSIALSLTRSDKIYTYLPLFHTAGWNVFTLPILFLGGRVLLDNNFDAEKAFKVIEGYKPTLSMGVPTTYKLMARHKDFLNTDFSSFRFLVSGAAPADNSVVMQYLNRGIRLGSGYGMTESCPNTSLPIDKMSIDELKEKINSVGVPFPFNEIKIITDEKHKIEAKVDEVGEVYILTPCAFTGYLNQEEETKSTLDGKWIKTGDIGKIDKDGFLFILDRKKRMFISGGENIFPREIEIVIEKNANTLMTYVFSIEDERLGDTGKALIVLKEDNIQKRKEMVNHIKNSLSKVKVPNHIEFVSNIPLNSVGKVSIQKVKELYG